MKKAVLQYYEQFKNRRILILHTMELLQFAVENAYNKKYKVLIESFKQVYETEVLRDSEKSTSRAFYKCKKSDDSQMIVRIRMQHIGTKIKIVGPKTDFSVCPPLGIKDLRIWAVIF